MQIAVRSVFFLLAFQNRIFPYFAGFYRTNKKDFPRMRTKVSSRISLYHFTANDRGSKATDSLSSEFWGLGFILFTSLVILQLSSGFLFCLFFLFFFSLAFPAISPGEVVVVHCATMLPYKWIMAIRGNVRGGDWVDLNRQSMFLARFSESIRLA